MIIKNLKIFLQNIQKNYPLTNIILKTIKFLIFYLFKNPHSLLAGPSQA